MLGGGNLKTLYELHGEGMSIRQIAATLDVSRNTVRRYLREPGVPQLKARPKRPSKLEPFKEHLERRLAAGVDNCAVLLRELRTQGYTGGYTILKDYVKPFRRLPQVKATMRYETNPGEQAQVDWGLFRHTVPEGGTRQVWAFVMVLSWSRAIYVEFVPRADAAAFLRCHLNAFQAFGGIPKRCLYDNAKVVVQGRDENGRPVWNQRFLDFSLRLGFDANLCRPYRAQTKGRVESGVKYVRRNFWPTARFTDLDGLNGQARAWVNGVAHTRIHGTTGKIPGQQLSVERPSLRPLPGLERLQPFLRETRKVQRDGFVQWQTSWYGVPWRYANREVEVQPGADVIEIWCGTDRIAVHPRALKARQRLTLPGQWNGLQNRDARPPKEPIAAMVPDIDVERRALAIYETAVAP